MPHNNVLRQPGTKNLFTALSLLVLTAGCAGVPAVFTPASNNAVQTTRLIGLVFIIAAVVFVVVEGFLVFTVLRYSQKRKNTPGLPPQIEGNRRLEIIWTAVPAVVLAVVFIISVGTLRSVSSQPEALAGILGPKPLVVKAIGHQWYWEFQYPDQKIITADEMHIPVGTSIQVEVESVDVVHSFWVPILGGKMDAVPGTTNILWMSANEPGTYLGQCAEFCGVEHAKMRLEVIAESKDQFDAWVTLQQAPMAANLTGDAAKGEQIFLSGSCTACHTISGTTAKGKVGPDLTHFASRQTFAGATMDNTPDNIVKWLADPQAVKPGNLMPNLNLSDSDIRLLLAFLQSLK